MRRLLKKFSFVIAILINLSILFTKNVFADMALPSEYSTRGNFIGYIKVAIILAIIIGIIFIFIVKKNKKKKDSLNNNEGYNNNDNATINLTNSNEDSRNE